MNLDALIITGPIGVDKSIVVREILGKFPDKFYFSISYTTRQIHPGEENGIDYYFIKRQQFERMILNDEFLEFIEYNGEYYGTCKNELEIAKSIGKICLFDLDIRGVKNIKKLKDYKSKVLYIYPHSLADFERKLRYKGEEQKNIQKRLNNAKRELDKLDYDLYDAIFNTKNINKCLDGVIKYITRLVEYEGEELCN